jgi:hypothetical protein
MQVWGVASATASEFARPSCKRISDQSGSAKQKKKKHKQNAIACNVVMQTQHHLDDDAYDGGESTILSKGDLVGMAVCTSQGSPTGLDSDQPAELPVPALAQAHTISIDVPRNWHEENTLQSGSSSSPLESMLNLESAPSKCIHVDTEMPDGTLT